MHRCSSLRSLLLFLLVLLASGAPTQASWLSDRTGINIDLNKEVGTGVAAMSAPVAEKFEESGNRLIDRMSGVLALQLDKLDATALKNEIRVQAIIGTSINQVDQDITKQIEKADEVLEKRLGNADVIAAKTELGFEQVARRILLSGCILIFVTVMALRFAGKAQITNSFPKDAGITAGFLAALYLIYLFVPHGNVQAIIDSHETAYRESVAIFDFREARYHLAQLKILTPDNASIRGREKKLELLDTVLNRPATYQTKEGILSFQRQLAQAHYLTPNDPDLAVVTAFVAWQTGVDRFDEYAAAVTCADALLRNPQKSSKGDEFVLRPLAVHYVKMYLANPLPDSVVNASLNTQAKGTDLPVRTLAEMQDSVARNQIGDNPLNPMLPMMQYDNAAQALYRVVTPAYVKLISNEAQKARIGASDPNQTRNLTSEESSLAQTIGEAWRKFDQDTVRASAPEVILWVARANSTSLKRSSPFNASTGKYGITEHNAFVADQLARVVPSNDPITGAPNNVRQLLDTELAAAQLRYDNDAATFEKLYPSVMGVLEVGSSADKKSNVRTLETVAASMGLFTCGTQFLCDDKTQAVSFPLQLEALLRDKTASIDQNSIQTSDFVLAIDAGALGQGYRTRPSFFL